MAVETCLSGLCHGEVGAETLRQWKFPETLVEAVRWQHRPERSSSPLASLLYLSEYWSDSEEDLPSCVRLKVACERSGIVLDALAGTGNKPQDSLESLRFAA